MLQNPRGFHKDSNARWPMEGSNVWWPLEGSNEEWPMESSNVWWLVEGEGKTPSSPLLTFSPTNLLKLSFFPLILRFYFTMVLDRYLHLSFLCLDL
jgi:hypothetical protein